MMAVDQYLKMITHVLALLVLLLLTVEKTEAIGQEYCQDGSTFLEATAIGNCFALVDIREGPIPMEQASDKCDTRFSGGKLVNVMSKVSLHPRMSSVTRDMYGPEESWVAGIEGEGRGGGGEVRVG